MPKKGYKHTAEALAKMSAVHLGSKRSPETRAKMSAAHRGAKSYNWKGGRRIKNGYFSILRPAHPFADYRGCVYEHRLIMEAFLGRILLSTEVVHHINGIVDDNRIENLMRFDFNKDHLAWHRTQERRNP